MFLEQVYDKQGAFIGVCDIGHVLVLVDAHIVEVTVWLDDAIGKNYFLDDRVRLKIKLDQLRTAADHPEILVVALWIGGIQDPEKIIFIGYDGLNANEMVGGTGIVRPGVPRLIGERYNMSGVCEIDDGNRMIG